MHQHAPASLLREGNKEVKSALGVAAYKVVRCCCREVMGGNLRLSTVIGAHNVSVSDLLEDERAWAQTPPASGPGSPILQHRSTASNLKPVNLNLAVHWPAAVCHRIAMTLRRFQGGAEA